MPIASLIQSLRLFVAGSAKTPPVASEGIDPSTPAGALWRATLEASPNGVLVLDAQRRLLHLNPIVRQLLRLDDEERWIGRPVQELVAELHERLDDGYRDALARLASPPQTPVELELRMRGREGDRILVRIAPLSGSDGEGLGHLVLLRDGGDESRLSASLGHTQRLETIGTLAAGIAHDFNNQLTVVLGNTRFAREQALDGETREALDDAVRAAERCARITRSLMAFARQAPVDLKILRIETLVREAEEILRSNLPDSVDLEVTLDRELPPLCADALQLRQILLNLGLNARDAVVDRGRIAIAVRHEPEEDGAGRLRIEVTDDGIGMSDAVRERIFDPFFTTKGSGGGTGLGLSVVHGMVETHGGAIEVESAPDSGSRFTVWLPAVATDSVAVPAPSPPRADTILVADDEAVLRRLVRRGLERSGYRVLEATDGVEALEIYHRHAEEVGLALLDLSMPRLDGRQVIETLHEERPELPIVLASGHFGEQPPPLPEPVELLPKPFSLELLLEILRRRLSENGHGPGVADPRPELPPA